MADASAYSSIHFDDGLDDDYEDDDDYDFDTLGGGGNNASPSSSLQSTSTVKSFLTAGCTFSFGSVAQCGLVGGLAQILWSVVRNIDAAGFFLQRRFSNSNAMRRMYISVNNVDVKRTPQHQYYERHSIELEPNHPLIHIQLLIQN